MGNKTLDTVTSSKSLGADFIRFMLIESGRTAGGHPIPPFDILVQKLIILEITSRAKFAFF